MATLHTERGDVPLTGDETVLYCTLADDRFRVFTREELCKVVDCRPRELDALAAKLRQKIQLATGLSYVHNVEVLDLTERGVWGVGFRLEEAIA